METPNPKSKIRLVKASKSKRFANYLIDRTVVFLFVFLLGAVFTILYPYHPIFESEVSSLYDYGLSAVLNLIFYIAFESTLHQTPGKLITKTKVVTQYGEKPDTRAIIGRSFARLIPFEAFSFLGESLTGWHDNLSKTIVIDLRASTLPNEGYWDDEVIDANL